GVESGLIREKMASASFDMAKSSKVDTKSLKVKRMAKDKPKQEEVTAPKPSQANGLPVLPVRDTVLFPHAVLPLTVGRDSSVQLINSLGENKQIIVVAQQDARIDSPVPTD